MINIITTPTSELPTSPTVSPTHQGVSLVLLALLAMNITSVTGRS